jgi:hypothetical protein
MQHRHISIERAAEVRLEVVVCLGETEVARCVFRMYCLKVQKSRYDYDYISC